MRRIHIYSFGLFIAFIALYSCENTTLPEKTSGALHALDFMYGQRAFPYDNIPADGFYKGYQKAVLEFRSNLQTRGSDPEPWEAIGPHNTAGRTLAIAFNPQNPQTIYAGSASGGLWRSRNLGSGVSWEYVPTGHPVLAVSSIAIHPRDSMIMYIGTGEVYSYQNVGSGAAYRSKRGTYGIGILKTTDGGRSWTKSLDWSYDQLRGVNAVEIAPAQPQIVYAATSEGVYKSINAGRTWALKLDVKLTMDVAVHPTNSDIVIAGCGNFGSDGKGIYVSSDGGDNWTLKTKPLPNDFQGKILLDFSRSSPNVVYASIGNGFGFNDGKSWLCRSDDAGQNWKIVNTTDYSKWQGWFAHDLAVNPLDDKTVMVVGIYAHKTTNGGSSLVQVTQPPQVTLGRPPVGKPDGPPTYTHIDHHVVRYHPTDSNIVIAASDGGVFLSQDGGKTYESRNGGYQSVQFYNGISIRPDDNSSMVGGLQDNATAYYVGDKAWWRLVGGDGSWSATNPENPDIMYSSWQGLNIVRTTDGFESTHKILNPENGDRAVFIAPFVLCPEQPKVLYAAAQKIYKTTDGGDTWKATNKGQKLADGHPFLSLAVSPSNCDVVYGGTAPFDINNGKPKIFYTLDGGKSWQEADNSSLPNRYPTDMTISPSDEGTAYVTYSGYGTGHLFKTENYGADWVDISTDLPDLPGNAIAVDPNLPSNLYYGNDMGVFVSEDGGLTWRDYSDGLPDAVLVMDLKIGKDTRKLFIGTHGNGAYNRDILDIPTNTQAFQEPGSMVYTYPNPASEYVIFEFDPSAQLRELKLAVYDLNGREIYRAKPTERLFRWSIESQNPGLYLYEIQNDQGRVARGQIMVQ